MAIASFGCKISAVVGGGLPVIAVSEGSGGFSGMASVFCPGSFGKLGSTGFAELAAAVLATSLADGGFGNAATGAAALGATGNFGKLAISVFGNTIGFVSALGGSAEGLSAGVAGAGNSAGGKASGTATFLSTFFTGGGAMSAGLLGNAGIGGKAGGRLSGAGGFLSSLAKAGSASFASFFTTGATAGSGNFAGDAGVGVGSFGSAGGFTASVTVGAGSAGGNFSALGNSFGASFFSKGGAGGTAGTGGGAPTGAFAIFFSSLMMPCFSGSLAKVFSRRFVTEGGKAGAGGGAVSGTGTKIGEEEITGAGCVKAFSKSVLPVFIFGSLFFAGAGLLTTTGFVSFAAGFSLTGLMLEGAVSASGDGNAGIAGAEDFGAFADGRTAAGSGGKSPGRGCNCWAVLGFASGLTAGNCAGGTTVGSGAFCQFVGFAGFAGAGGGGATGTGAGAGVRTGAGIGAAIGIGAGEAMGAGAAWGAGGAAVCGALTGADGIVFAPRLLRDLAFDGWPVSGNAEGVGVGATGAATGSGRVKGCAGTSGRFSTGMARSTTGGATGTGVGAAGIGAGVAACRPRSASRFTSTLGAALAGWASAGIAPSPHAMLHTLASKPARRAVTGEKRRFAIA